MVKQLREFHTPKELATLYATPHDARRFGDHAPRVAKTIEMGAAYAERENVKSIADLSCGNGEIARGIRDTRQAKLFLGDLAPGYPTMGPIEGTIWDIPQVDMFVLSETLEHLENPARLLWLIRIKARSLVLSTPIDNWNDTNPEHYWAWSRGDVEDMATSAGWQVDDFANVDMRAVPGSYNFGIWTLR